MLKMYIDAFSKNMLTGDICRDMIQSSDDISSRDIIIAQLRKVRQHKIRQHKIKQH